MGKGALMLIRIVAGAVGVAFGFAVGSLFGQETGSYVGTALGGIFGLAGKEIGESIGSEMGGVLGESLVEAVFSAAKGGMTVRAKQVIIDFRPLIFITFIGLAGVVFFFWMGLFQWIGTDLLGQDSDSWGVGLLRLASLITFGIAITACLGSDDKEGS